MKKFSFISDVDTKRIDIFLTERLNDFSRSYIQKLILNGNVKVNEKVIKPNYNVSLNDNIHILIPEAKRLSIEPEDIKLDIIYEDDDIIVVNKPKGMVVHPAAGNYSGTLVNALLSYCKDSLSDINGVIRPGIVHRIDKDTTGVLVVAKNNKAHIDLSDKLKAHDIKRVYEAICEGVIKEDAATVDAPIGRHPVDRKKMSVNLKNGRQAVTHFKVLERFKNHTYVELELETGRTHQIRVHMEYIGHPLLGDEVYGRKKQKFDIIGQALHARTLGFLHPKNSNYLEFNSKLPRSFSDILDKLRAESF